ncbi:hypothetical protein HBB16_21765 [Pseudonocardia sp. MCCB 268]|nr:hypothetical protein [Pseudonocardia cytotoxica]
MGEPPASAATISSGAARTRLGRPPRAHETCAGLGDLAGNGARRRPRLRPASAWRRPRVPGRRPGAATPPPSPRRGTATAGSARTRRASASCWDYTTVSGCPPA